MQVTLTLEAPEGTTHYLVRADGTLEWFLEQPNRGWLYSSAKAPGWNACGPLRNCAEKTPVAQAATVDLPEADPATPNLRLVQAVEAMLLVQAHQLGGVVRTAQNYDEVQDAMDTVTREAGDLLNGISITFDEQQKD